MTALPGLPSNICVDLGRRAAVPTRAGDLDIDSDGRVDGADPEPVEGVERQTRVAERGIVAADSAVLENLKSSLGSPKGTRLFRSPRLEFKSIGPGNQILVCLNCVYMYSAP